MINWPKIARLRTAFVGHQVETEQKQVRYEFDPSAPIELTHLTDLQYGHKAFEIDKFLAHREWILAHPARFVLLGGDLIDAATVLSVGSPHENDGEPIDQIERLTELLAPIRDRILGYVGGNHERRTCKTYGDAGRQIAHALHIPYSRGVQHIDITLGAWQPFRVTLWHGKGTAGTKGGQAQMLHKFMSQGYSDAYLVGHLHSGLVLYDWKQDRTPEGQRLRKVVGIMSTSFLGWWGTYAEVACLAPSEPLMGRIVLEPTGHYEVTLR